MRITVLAENTAIDDRFGAEHGLSLFIETGDTKILFDMGQGELFAHNASRCGIDLSTADFAVLSHGHYDHGGGLRHFLRLNDHAPVYLSRYAFEPHYNAAGRYIGLDPALRDCDRLIYTADQYAVADGMTLDTLADTDMVYPVDTAGLTAERDGIMQPDDFRHEQYLLIEENGRRILFSGCSHKGILNILHRFEPDVLIGGFHFFKMPVDHVLEEYADRLAQRSTVFYTCHCTGSEQYACLKRRMERLNALSSGESVTI